jgi:hypothetical protein
MFPIQRAIEARIKSKKEVLRNEKGSSAVEATILGLNTKSGLRPNSPY